MQDKDILKKRQAAIYGVDERSQIRRSYENPVVQHLYEAFLGEPLSHEVGRVGLLSGEKSCVCSGRQSKPPRPPHTAQAQ